MAKTLVIVESPAKAKTIKKYLGTGYDVLASKGHVKDLPKNQNAVDVANDFTEKYEVIAGKEKILDELKAAAKKADTVLLATDPDREGEAIAWHIYEEIRNDKLKVDRVEFHEITKRGVDHGIHQPRPLDNDLYDAQRARRVLDRIVGYDVSALVWAKLAFGLSAGRVQSVALRLIVDREREIDAFVPEEYWNVSVGLTVPKGAGFTAKLAAADGEKLEVKNGDQAAAVREDLASAKYKVAKVTRREQKRNPPAPYTTSKLQQDATNVLHFGTKRTMQIAQGLYEGVDLKQDGGPVGLITYIRTDSTRVSDEAITEVRQTIEKRYGKAFVPDKPNVFKSKKNAQDAHEAIRPADVTLHPDMVKKHLKDEQYKLYKLIWNRFVASQMTPAVYDRTTVEIQADTTRASASKKSYMLRATGRVLKASGFLEVTEGQREFAGDDEVDAQAATDDASVTTKAVAERAEEESDALLPEMNENDALALQTPPGVLTEQKFTQPPARYNEGSLVRELEKRGIGRPSTYAEIISKVQQRAYVEKLPGGAFQPTQLGKFVVEGLVRSNLDFMDPNFTAQMEEELDEVGTGTLKRGELLKRFYKRFRQQLEQSKKLASWKPPSEKTDISCEECGEGVMIKKWGKNGWFLSCSRYPKCKATRDLAANGTAAAASVRETDIQCDKCGKPMVIRAGRYGDFLSCTGYPTCKNARPVPLGVACPKCGGDLIEVRSRKKGGRTFYGCSNFNAEEKCDFKLWAKPVPTPCPQCNAPFVTRVQGKKPMLVCATKDCGFKQELTEEDEAAAQAAAIPADGIVRLASSMSNKRPPPPIDLDAEEQDEDEPKAAPKKATKVAAKKASKAADKPAAKSAAKPAAKASVKAAARTAKPAAKAVIKRPASKDATKASPAKPSKSK